MRSTPARSFLAGADLVALSARHDASQGARAYQVVKGNQPVVTIMLSGED